MKSALKLDIVIPENRHLEIDLPQELPSGPAELIVLTGGEGTRKRELRPIGIDAGKGRIADDFDAPLPEETLRLFEGRS